jgi:hypothetical protein
MIRKVNILFEKGYLHVLGKGSRLLKVPGEVKLGKRKYKVRFD